MATTHGGHRKDTTIDHFVARTDISYKALLIAMPRIYNGLQKSRKPAGLNRYQSRQMVTEMAKIFGSAKYRHYKNILVCDCFSLKFLLDFVEAHGRTQFTVLVARLALTWSEAQAIAQLLIQGGYTIVLDRNLFGTTTAAPAGTSVATTSGPSASATTSGPSASATTSASTGTMLISTTSKATQTLNQVFELPLNWTSAEDQIGHRKVELCPKSAEFKQVMQMLRGANGHKILRISRIENARLFQQYQIHKKHVALTCPPGTEIERVLYHGTKVYCLDGICSSGFDRSLAGDAVGAMYGNGSYFSTSLHYSARPMYAKEGLVLLCHVLVGQPVQGFKGQKVLPMKAVHPGIRHESGVDNLTRPSMYVLYNDVAVYPSYLLEVGPDRDDSL